MKLRKGWRFDTSVVGVQPGQVCLRSPAGWVHRWSAGGHALYARAGQRYAEGSRRSLMAAMIAAEQSHRNSRRRRRKAMRRRG